METTRRLPRPTSSVCGEILELPGCSEASSRPSSPSIRGTEKPQMSASITPTVNPSAAIAQARFTVTDDLPTPPLPEATMTTLVVGDSEVWSGRSAMRRRARSIAVAFSSWVSSDQSIRTFTTPGSPPTRARTSFWICARSGHPLVVSATCTWATPSSSIRAPLAMPSSTMSRPSSGSMTPRSSPITSSEVGSGGVVAAGCGAVSEDSEGIP